MLVYREGGHLLFATLTLHAATTPSDSCIGHSCRGHLSFISQTRAHYSIQRKHEHEHYALRGYPMAWGSRFVVYLSVQNPQATKANLQAIFVCTYLVGPKELKSEISLKTRNTPTHDIRLLHVAQTPDEAFG